MLVANHLAALGLLLQDRMTEGFEAMSAPGAAALLSLHFRGELTVTALARILGTSQPAATRLLDGLARAGLIERGERAGRTVAVRLTAAGTARAAALNAARLTAAEALLAPLGAAERAALARLLAKLLAEATHSRGEAHTTCRLCDHALCDGPACPVGTRATAIERSEHADRA